jgi:DNA polymerase III subunit beta
MQERVVRVLFDVKALVVAWKVAARACPGRSPKDVLLTVRLEATETGCTLEGTDLEAWVKVDVLGTRVVEPGVVQLPEGIFGKILEAVAKEPELLLETKGNHLLVRAGSDDWELDLYDADTFPTMPPLPEDDPHKVAAADLQQAIKRTAWAVQKKVLDARFNIFGTLVELAPERLALVAFGKNCIARQEVPAVCRPPSIDQQCILPEKLLGLLGHALPDDETPIELVFSSSNIFVRHPGLTIVGRLAEGLFPIWGRYVKSDLPHRARIEVGLLKAAFERASAVIGDESRCIGFHFEPGRLTLQGRRVNAGRARASLAVQCEEEFAYAYDGTTWPDMLKTLPESAVLEANLGDGEQSVFRFEGFLFAIAYMQEPPPR